MAAGKTTERITLLLMFPNGHVQHTVEFNTVVTEEKEILDHLKAANTVTAMEAKYLRLLAKLNGEMGTLEEDLSFTLDVDELKSDTVDHVICVQVQ